MPGWEKWRTNEKSMHEIAVPQNVYRHLQAGFAANNARMCVNFADLEHRIFHPGDAFVDVIKWLWGGIQGGEVTGDVPLPREMEESPEFRMLAGVKGTAVSGEALAFTLLVDHFCAVNGFLAELDPAPRPMGIEEMITGLRLAGLQKYLGPREWERICLMIRDDVPGQAGLEEDE
jgi:hypothetical protein